MEIILKSHLILKTHQFLSPNTQVVSTDCQCHVKIWYTMYSNMYMSKALFDIMYPFRPGEL